MKTLIAIFAFVVFVHAPALTQNCTECKSRTLHVYDFDYWQLPVPVADHDSIVDFINAVGIAARIAKYLEWNDPMRDCIVTSTASVGANITATMALANPILLGTIMQMQDRRTGAGESSDYVLTGRISRFTNRFIVDASVRTGPTDEHVIGIAETTLGLSPNGDPDQVATTLREDLGPIYESIMEFEKQKRDSGPPYAIFPKVTITPAKKTLDFHEVTSVHIVVTDCDGEPLKGRTVRLTNDEGTLDQTSVTTDDQGTADVLFTAGGTPTLAVILGTLSYTTGYGKTTETTSDPAGIHIKMPADSWYAEVSYSRSTRDYTTMTADAGPSQWARYETNDDIWYVTWLKAFLVTKPGSNTVFFQSDTLFTELKSWASETRHDLSRDWYWGEGAGYDNNSTVNTSANATNAPKPKIDLHIGSTTYYFGISGIKAQQTGAGQTTYYSWSPGGTDYTVTPATIDPTTTLGASVQGPNKDSSYALVDTDPFGSTTTNVTQTFSWNGKDLCLLSCTQHVYSHSQITGSGVVTTDEQSTDLVVNLAMVYNKGTTGVGCLENHTIASTFSLEQNYPNPFNPVTTIGFRLPAGQAGVPGSVSQNPEPSTQDPRPGTRAVRLIVYDVLGREVAVLVDGQREPGYYKALFDAHGLASGVYLYRLTAGDFVQTGNMILLK